MPQQGWSQILLPNVLQSCIRITACIRKLKIETKSCFDELSKTFSRIILPHYIWVKVGYYVNGCSSQINLLIRNDFGIEATKFWFWKMYTSNANLLNKNYLFKLIEMIYFRTILYQNLLNEFYKIARYFLVSTTFKISVATSIQFLSFVSTQQHTQLVLICLTMFYTPKGCLTYCTVLHFSFIDSK